MKTSFLKKVKLNLGFLSVLVFLFSASESLAMTKISLNPSKVLKSSRWLNYPYALNGQRTFKFCNDVVTETSIIPETSPSIQDQDNVCVGYNYHFWLPFSCASVTWHVYNGSIVTSYSAYDKVIQFNSNIFVDGYANVWVDVIDPATGDPYSYEFAFFPSTVCD